MPTWVYLLIAILIILFLIVLFFISYYINKKTPVPKGCEHLKIDETNCKACNNFDCSLNKNQENSKEIKDENKIKEK